MIRLNLVVVVVVVSRLNQPTLIGSLQAWDCNDAIILQLNSLCANNFFWL